MKTDLMSLFPSELTDFVLSLGEPKYRASQLFSWLYKVDSFAEMKNLPKSFLAKLEETAFLDRLTVKNKLVSADGTVKYLFSLSDGELIESVFMRYKHGNTVCLSTQVGCRMGCRFCASTLKGKIRDLRPSEMLGQVLAIEKDLHETVSNLVLMGMGEPLDNYDNVVRFVRMLGEEGGVHIGMRHISLSTCGLVDRIRELAEENLQINLSLSLHAPNDDIRKQMMPIANKYSIDDVLSACRDYAEKTGRRIHIEYTVVHGVNDSPEHARELANRLRGMLCHVNLIPVNPIKEREFVPPDKKSVQVFAKLLNNFGICATIRRTLGEDVDASCGQLRQRALKE